MSSIKLAFEHPWLLLTAIPAFAIVLLPFLRLPARRRKAFRRIAPMVIHLLVVAMLVLLVSGFTVVRTTEDKAVMVLVDLSESTTPVREELETHARQLLELIDHKTPVGILAFAQNQLYSLELTMDQPITLAKVGADATDIAGALTYAANQLPGDRAGHIILLSDGKQTDGDAITTAQYLASKGIRVDAMYFDTTLTTQEVQISSFLAPEGVYVGEQLVFTADVQSNYEGTVRLSLYDASGKLTTISGKITEGSNVFEIAVPATAAGTYAYRLALETQGDTLSKNNQSYAFVKIAGESSVLLIADTIGNAAPLRGILETAYSVTVVTARNAPETITELCDYDQVILSNVDYGQLPEGYDALLETYVKVFGRSLLAVGGENTFMYGNMGGTAIEQLLPVTFTLQEESEGKSVALMLVLDCSTSMVMNNTYLHVAKQGAIKCVEAMTANDYVGVVSFNRTAYLNAPLVPATEENRDNVTRVISALTTNRSTYYSEAIRLAHQELKNCDADICHIIFLSDGQPGDHGYTRAVQDAAADGITVSTIGLGFSSEILDEMSQLGNGRYYYVSQATDLPNIMLSETEQVIISSLRTGDFPVMIKKDSALTAGITELPNLGGYLGTTRKEEATVYLTTDEGHPIYASWAYGAGTVACFTSDLRGNWSAAWMDDPAVADLIRNMVETSLPKVHHDSSMTAQVQLRGQTAEVTVRTALVTEDVVSLVVSEDGNGKTYILAQTEPGVYKGSFPAEKAGVYSLMFTQTDKDGQIVDYLDTALAVSYSQEYNAFGPSGEQLLMGICNTCGGAIHTEAAQLAQVKVTTISKIHNPRVLFAVLCCILMLADIAIRKLRWKDIRNYFLRK